MAGQSERGPNGREAVFTSEVHRTAPCPFGVVGKVRSRLGRLDPRVRGAARCLQLTVLET